MDSKMACSRMPLPIWLIICWPVMQWHNKMHKVKSWRRIRNNNKIWRWWSNSLMLCRCKIWCLKNSSSSNNKITLLMCYLNNRIINKWIWIHFGMKLDRLMPNLSKSIPLRCNNQVVSSSNHGWIQWWWIDLLCINNQCKIKINKL